MTIYDDMEVQRARHEMHVWQLEWKRETEHRKELEVENAKLRELAKAAWGCVNRHVSCDECRVVCCGCTLQSAMRELGIEVEE